MTSLCSNSCTVGNKSCILLFMSQYSWWEVTANDADFWPRQTGSDYIGFRDTISDCKLLMSLIKHVKIGRDLSVDKNILNTSREGRPTSDSLSLSLSTDKDSSFHYSQGTAHRWAHSTSVFSTRKTSSQQKTKAWLAREKKTCLLSSFFFVTGYLQRIWVTLVISENENLCSRKQTQE